MSVTKVGAQMYFEIVLLLQVFQTVRKRANNPLVKNRRALNDPNERLKKVLLRLFRISFWASDCEALIKTDRIDVKNHICVVLFNFVKVLYDVL